MKLWRVLHISAEIEQLREQLTSLRSPEASNTQTQVQAQSSRKGFYWVLPHGFPLRGFPPPPVEKQEFPPPGGFHPPRGHVGFRGMQYASDPYSLREWLDRVTADRGVYSNHSHWQTLASLRICESPFWLLENILQFIRCHTIRRHHSITRGGSLQCLLMDGQTPFSFNLDFQFTIASWHTSSIFFPASWFCSFLFRLGICIYEHPNCWAFHSSLTPCEIQAWLVFVSTFTQLLPAFVVIDVRTHSCWASLHAKLIGVCKHPCDPCQLAGGWWLCAASLIMLPCQDAGGY